MFSTANGIPNNITIRGNYFYDDPTTTTQHGDDVYAGGLFLGGPSAGGYRNFLIEENIIDTNTPIGLFVTDANENIVIRNNTVLGSGSIRFGDGDCTGATVYNNVCKSISQEVKAGNIFPPPEQIYNNHIYTDEGAIFQNGGDGATWQGFLPQPGSPIDFGSGVGALTRLAELQANPLPQGPYAPPYFEPINTATAPFEKPQPASPGDLGWQPTPSGYGSGGQPPSLPDHGNVTFSIGVS